jgi:hypothetical protein
VACGQEESLLAMLTGSNLLAKVKELGDICMSDLVRSCGYVRRKQDGDQRLNFTAMLSLQYGDEFEIKRCGKQVRLVPMGGEEGEE